MRLHRLRLVNFRQYADSDIVVGPGITGIIGPNGSGKSTLLEAIAWAIYGNPAARGDKDGIRNLRAKARSSVRVELEFGLGAHEYRVVRGLHNAELYQDGGVVANSLTEVTVKLERVLGMRHDEFFNTYFTGQKELAVMASLGKTDRAAFLSRVLGYDRLRLAQERVRERRNALASELRGLGAGLPEGARRGAGRHTAAAPPRGGGRAAPGGGRPAPAAGRRGSPRGARGRGRGGAGAGAAVGGGGAPGRGAAGGGGGGKGIRGAPPHGAAPPVRRSEGAAGQDRAARARGRMPDLPSAARGGARCGARHPRPAAAGHRGRRQVFPPAAGAAGPAARGGDDGRGPAGRPAGRQPPGQRARPRAARPGAGAPPRDAGAGGGGAAGSRSRERKS